VLEPRDRYDVSRAMNIVNGTRIGWDEKQKYQERLAELSAKGYITSEEYEARITWLDNAHTQAEMNAAFQDLPPMPLTEYVPPPAKVSKIEKTGQFVVFSPVFCGAFAGFEFALLILAIVAGSVSLMMCTSILITYWVTMMVIRMKQNNERKSS
jgi:hypothetical protein